MTSKKEKSLGKDKNSHIVWNIILFLVIFGVLFTMGIHSHGLSTKLFSGDYEEIPYKAISSRDRIYGVVTVGDSVVWMAGNYGKILKSTDGGENFIKQDFPVSDDLQDIAAWDKNRAVAVGNQGVVLVTSDGGQTWTKISDLPRSRIANKLLRVVTQDKGEAYAIGVMGMLMKSYDYGRTWRRLDEEQDVAWNDIGFADRNTGWVVGEFGRIMKTTDGGNTWELQQSPIESSVMGIAVKDENHVGVCCLEGVVLWTNNGGVTWNKSQTETDEHLNRIIYNKNRWISVGNGGVLALNEKIDQSWNIDRLSKHDFTWHTDIEFFNEDYFIVGRTTGKWNGTDWKYL